MDMNLLDSYNFKDNNRFKELELKRQVLQRTAIEKENTIEKEVNVLLQIETELEKLSKLTKQAEKEKDRLLEQWEIAANYFNSNNENMQSTVQETQKINENARKMYSKMKEDKQVYEDYFEKNEELQFELSNISKSINELKVSTIKKQESSNHMLSEVFASRILLSKLSNKLSNERSKRKHLHEKVNSLNKQIKRKKNEIEILEQNSINTRNKSMTNEERLNALEKIFEEQQKLSNKLLLDNDKLQTTSFYNSSEVKKLKAKIDLMKLQLERNNDTLLGFARDELKLGQQIMDKKEILYNLSFQLEIISSKMTEVEGNLDIHTLQEHQDQLFNLRSELNRATEYQNQLDKQLKMAENECHYLTKEVEKFQTELQVLQKRNQEMDIRNFGDIKEIQQLKDQNQQCHMEELLLKLKVAQIKKIMDDECEKAFSLSKQREELTADINLRKAEVTAILERLNGEKKILMDDKSLNKRQLDFVIQKINQKQNKYDILLASIGTNSHSFTISEYHIRISQEKLELQEIGDDLDNRVQKLENEVRAMENTLHVLNTTNRCYKTSLSYMDPESSEYKEKTRLKEIHNNIKSSIKQNNKNIIEIKRQIEDLKMKNQETENELNNTTTLLDSKRINLKRVLKDIEGQNLKLERVESTIRCSLNGLEKKYHGDNEKIKILDHIKKDVKLRLLKKINKTSLEILSEMSIRYIELEPTAKQYLSEKNLTLPTISNLMSFPSSLKIKSNCESSSISLSNSSISHSSIKEKSTNLFVEK
ncbi:coiled-coil domain-containing protein 39-like isoform X2 [Daktulosphaira vitifoliae]|nr:coiled-coil domain-containing protein 39-like isoform X2 [Daktulosphaira vitifoliae]